MSVQKEQRGIFNDLVFLLHGLLGRRYYEVDLSVLHKVVDHFLHLDKNNLWLWGCLSYGTTIPNSFVTTSPLAKFITSTTTYL